MDHREVKYSLAALLVIFFIIAILFKKIISYLFCPLPNYTGKLYRGKSLYLFLFHFFISLGISIGIYSLLGTNEKVSSIFEDVRIRLLTIVGFWIMFFYFVGLAIEMYLLKTDGEYKN